MSEFCDESEGSEDSPERSLSRSSSKGDSEDVGRSLTGDGDWGSKSVLN